MLVDRTGWSVTAATFYGSDPEFGPQTLVDNKIGTLNAYASGNSQPFNWVQVDFGQIIGVRKRSIS